MFRRKWIRMFRKLSAASSRGANATKQSILVAAAQWIASLVLAMTAQILLCALSLPTVPRHRRSSSLPLAGRVARSAGWGWFAKGYSPPPVTSFAPLTMCHPPHKVGGIRKSGRDKKESRRCCACSLIRCEKRTRRSNALSLLQWIASLRSQQRNSTTWLFEIQIGDDPQPCGRARPAIHAFLQSSARRNAKIRQSRCCFGGSVRRLEPRRYIRSI